MVLSKEPNNVHALCFLGALECERGEHDKGLEHIKRAITIDPQFSQGYCNLGVALHGKRDWQEAEKAFRQALTIKPDYAQAYSYLGSSLAAQSKLDEAEKNCRRALQLRPNHVGALINLADVVRKQGKPNEAEVIYKRIVESNSESIEALTGLGISLFLQNKLDSAMVVFEKAITLNPKHDEAYFRLGMTLARDGRLQDAQSAFRQALSLKPNRVEALNHLADAFRVSGKPHEAIQVYRQALEIDPDDSHTHSNMLLTYQYVPGEVSPNYIEVARAWDQTHAHSGSIQDFTNIPDPERPLRIGYVSPDFRNHVVSYFMEPILGAHDRKHFEVFCYAGVYCPDEVTERIRQISDHWWSTMGKDDAAVAERIRADGIDILVDLAGHTGGNRLPVFTRKPAPLQVTYLGFPNTTGLSAMDYRLTDSRAGPPGLADRSHSETLIRLPHGFLCYLPSSKAPEVAPLPVRKSGHVTFGSFNNLAKVTPENVAVWARILHRVPQARLLLKAHALADDETRCRYHALFAEADVPAERVELVGWQPSAQGHLALYDRVDIGVDTFPYNGTTTTCEAMWMGVPVVTLAGDRHAARVGASLLHTVGLDENITQTLDDYVERAIELVGNEAKLADLRASLRERMERSQLCNSNLITGTIESAYRAMWRRWRAGLPPGEILPF